MKYYRRPCYLVFAGLTSLAACGHQSGMVITARGSTLNGALHFDRCVASDGAVPDVAYAEFPFSLAWKKIPLTSLRSIVVTDATFSVIQRSNGLWVLARPLVASSLYEFCEIRYQSTMFRSTRYDVLRYLYEDASGLHEVSQDPDAFLRAARTWFASCPGLVEQLSRKNFRRPLEKERPNGPDHYEMVERDDLVDAVLRFHSCIK